MTKTSGPRRQASLLEPRVGPLVSVNCDQSFDTSPRFFHRCARCGGENTKGDGAESQLKEPVTSRGFQIVVPLRGRARDNADFAIVESEIVVERRLRTSRGVRIR